MLLDFDEGGLFWSGGSGKRMLTRRYLFLIRTIAFKDLCLFLNRLG